MYVCIYIYTYLYTLGLHMSLNIYIYIHNDRQYSYTWMYQFPILHFAIFIEGNRFVMQDPVGLHFKPETYRSFYIISTDRKANKMNTNWAEPARNTHYSRTQPKFLSRNGWWMASNITYPYWEPRLRQFWKMRPGRQSLHFQRGQRVDFVVLRSTVP